MRVESFLLESARRFPDKTALVAGPERLSDHRADEKNQEIAASHAQPLNLAAGLNYGSTEPPPIPPDEWPLTTRS